MFRPSAWTKTPSVAFSSLLAITVVPALMLYFISGTPFLVNAEAAAFRTSPHCTYWMDFLSSTFDRRTYGERRLAASDAERIAHPLTSA
jgi:Cu/Ag efflux pump CusA